MILIADSGSTKCDWHLYDEKNNKVFQKRTIGINPMILSDAEIRLILQLVKVDIPLEVSRVEFYCAGGSHEESKHRLVGLFHECFSRAKILIEDDLEMAVKCIKGGVGVLCILGTGSNSCFFDGTNLHKRLPDLGYQVMDEGSGNYYGRELLRSYAYGYMPDELKENFEHTYNLQTNAILKELYNGENPSSYLANFAQFLIQYQEHVFIKRLIKKGLDKVFGHVLGPYHSEMKKHPIYFVGSIAFFLQNVIREEAYKRGYTTLYFIRKPIEHIVNDF
ncbi:N-acetylglucosamine kinase [Allomuricauda sp. M10]|jgi:Predicted N-acetylglucosamine kinase|uniref:N-acetylglucosamine kinase n=1 Tax=Allomuricauda sp. M10 TaxID=2683292 RepID=UPI001D195987|nr:N-acetylglucosamine kinase [Muricauda sp. M10]